MDWTLIFGLVFLGIFIFMLVVGIVLECINKKERKEAWRLFNDFENIRKLKNTNPNEFINKSFKIITGVRPGTWSGFRVKESKHGKGWFVEGDYFDEKRFWPSNNKLFGDEHYPNSYLSKTMAEKELVKILERLTDFVIKCENDARDFEARRED